MSDHDREHGHGQGRGHSHGHRHGGEGEQGDDHRRDRHGNPEHFEAYLARLQDPERSAWQKPDEVVQALGLSPGNVVCDLGTGPGTFAIPLARAVGPGGRVHAIDVEPRMLEVLARRVREAGVGNVVAHLGAEEGISLPAEPCDLVLLVNVLHHFPDPAEALRRLATALRPGGRIANVDFHEQDLPVGPPPDHKLSRADFLSAAAEAGLVVAKEWTFLPYQYFVVLRRD